ncbi:MAG TPA: universal stress protein, partial [Pedobacter sp.]
NPGSLPEKNGDMTYSFKDVQSGAVIQAIKKEIIAAEAELLIMVPGKYGFWSSLLHRSKTNMMASGLNVPLLSVPA